MNTYSVAEAADALGVSDDTIRRWLDSGRLDRADSDGRTIVIRGADLARVATELAGEFHNDRPRAQSVSARNRMPGIVVGVKTDAVMAQVEMMCGPFRVVSLLSTEAVEELGLEIGSRAVASVKSTNVVLERP